MRDYGGGTSQLGYERKLDQYIAHLTAVFREAYRVGARDSLLMVVMGDNYGEGIYRRSTLADQERPLDSNRKQCLGIPFQLAFAMVDTGWRWRMTIIWDKARSWAPRVGH